MQLRRSPAEVVPVGEILREEMETRGWSQSDLAEILRRPLQAVNEILAGKKGVTPETAKALGAAFDVPPEFWLELENAYRLSRVSENSEDVKRRARLFHLVPLRELVKRGWVPKTDDLGVTERAVCEFLEIPSIDAQPKYDFAARKSDGYESVSQAQVAWFYRCLHLSKQRPLRTTFKIKTFESAVGGLRRLSLSDDLIKTVPAALEGLGVRLVLLEPIPASKIDGACFWIDGGRPVVAISMRFDRVDHFWHTLLHELAHILEGPGGKSHLDVDLFRAPAEGKGKRPACEEEADRRACEWLVPRKDLELFIKQAKPFYSQQAIAGFASAAGVHPGVVVGQLQHLGVIPFSHGRKMLVNVKHLLPIEV